MPTERFDIAKRDTSGYSEEEKAEIEKAIYESIDYEDIPEDCRNAAISIEDKRFMTNHGIDLKGFGRSIISILPFVNLGGGSTITQQMVKMSTDRYYNRTPLDKLKEMVWAFRLTNDYSKEELLTRYLNNVYLGDYNYGVQAASQAYFKKSVNFLTLNECAYLAGIIQSPNTYAPISGSNAIGEIRKNVVLEEMREEEYIL